MIAVLRCPGQYADCRVVLPAAPVPGDLIEAFDTTWRVIDRKFVLPATGEAEVVLRVERLSDDD